MVTIASTCSAQDINEVNQKKEYTLIATNLLNQIFTDTRLNDHAIKCWQVLFNKARFHPELEITISYGRLAFELGKSKRTIFRYIKTLSQYGYVTIKNNTNPQEGLLPNTLLIRAPITFVENTKKDKDRITRADFISTKDELTKKNKNLDETLATQNNPPSHPLDATFLNEAAYEIDLIETLNKSTISNEDNAITCSSVYENLSNQIIKTQKNEVKNTENNLSDETRLSLGDSDMNDMYINNIKYINNNNITKPVVVDRLIDTLSENKDSIDQLQKNILNLERKMELAEKEWLAETNSKERMKKLRYFGEIESTLISQRYLREQLENKTKQNIQHKKIDEKLNNSNLYIKNLAGNRQVSDFAIKRIHQQLDNCGIQKNDQTRLVNELLFEVRFGTLVFNSSNKEENSIDRAINIALKLIKERRWSTPSGLNHFVQSMAITERIAQ
jgi:hypothetical protein